MVSINDIEINANNIELLLSTVKKRQKIRLTTLSPITYLNLNTNELLFEKLNLKEKLTESRRGEKKLIIAPSKSTTIVKGEHAKLADSKLNDEVFYLIMILSLNKEKIKRKENSNDKVIFIIFKST